MRDQLSARGLRIVFAADTHPHVDVLSGAGQLASTDAAKVLRLPPGGRPEIVEPANRLHLRRPLVTHPYRLYPVADHIADKVWAALDTNERVRHVFAGRVGLHYFDI